MSDIEAIIQATFPPALTADAAIIAKQIEVGAAGSAGWQFGQFFEVTLAEGTVSIPERIYVGIACPATLSAVAKRMRLCLLTRHHDGRVRETALRSLIRAGEPWTLPYLYRLIGEYVVEILQVIDDGLGVYAEDDLRDFEARNPRFVQITRSRVSSYYNCYYRHAFPDSRTYPGFRILTQLKDRISLGSRKVDS